MTDYPFAFDAPALSDLATARRLRTHQEMTANLRSVRSALADAARLEQCDECETTGKNCYRHRRDTPPAPGPIWTNGQAAEDTRPACPPWCMTATAMHDTGPAALTRTHRANVLTFDTHDTDDMPVPLAIDLERIDHRTPTGWEAGQTRACLMVGTAFYGGPPVYLTAAEATHLGMATIGATAVMR